MTTLQAPAPHFQVARELAALGANETVVAAALLHDVLDDTALWEGQLVAMLRDDDVVALVKQVTSGARAWVAEGRGGGEGGTQAGSGQGGVSGRGLPPWVRPPTPPRARPGVPPGRPVAALPLAPGHQR